MKSPDEYFPICINYAQVTAEKLTKICQLNESALGRGQALSQMSLK
jgi:hypothetical protein